MKDLRKQAKQLAAAPYTEWVVRDETTNGRPIYLMSHPELPGCMAQGETIEEARASLGDARFEYILSLLEDGLDVPVPQTQATQTVSTKPNEDTYQGTGSADRRQSNASAGQPLGTISLVTP